MSILAEDFLGLAGVIMLGRVASTVALAHLAKETLRHQPQHLHPRYFLGKEGYFKDRQRVKTFVDEFKVFTLRVLPKVKVAVH